MNPDNVPLAAQDANDSLFVGGREAGKESCLFRSLGQFRVGHFLHIIAQQHRVGEESHVPAHFAAYQVVVAGEDLYHHTMFVQCFDCARGGTFGRVQKCDIPFQHEIAFIVPGAGLFPRQLFDCYRQNPESIIAKARVLVLQPFDQGRVHGRHLPIQLEMGTLMENLFRSALGQEDRLAFRALDEYGHHASRKVERYLVQLLVLLDQGLPMKIRTVQNRRVKQVLETRLEVADEVAIHEHFIRFASGDIAVPLKDDPIFGERAGFVGA